MTFRSRIPLTYGLALLCAGPALAQTPERVAAHTDWSVFVANDPKECYIVSPPTSSESANLDPLPVRTPRRVRTAGPAVGSRPSDDASTQ